MDKEYCQSSCVVNHLMNTTLALQMIRSSRLYSLSTSTIIQRETTKVQKKKQTNEKRSPTNMCIYVQTVCPRCSYIMGYFWEKKCSQHNQYHMQEYKEVEHPSYCNRETCVPPKSPERSSPNRHYHGHDWHLRLA